MNKLEEYLKIAQLHKEVLFDCLEKIENELL